MPKCYMAATVFLTKIKKKCTYGIQCQIVSKQKTSINKAKGLEINAML
jgi:hypothetical protein